MWLDLKLQDIFDVTTFMLTHTHTHTYTYTFSIRSDYIDISREFYSDPEGWLQGKFPNANTPLPSHLVLFDVLVPVSWLLCKPKCLFVIVYFSVENCFFFIQISLWGGNRISLMLIIIAFCLTLVLLYSLGDQTVSYSLSRVLSLWT